MSVLFKKRQKGMTTRSGVRYRGRSKKLDTLFSCQGKHHTTVANAHAQEWKRLTEAQDAWGKILGANPSKCRMPGHFSDPMPKNAYLESKRRMNEDMVRSLATQASNGGKAVPVKPFVHLLSRFLLGHGLTRKMLTSLPPASFPTVDAAVEYVFAKVLAALYDRMRVRRAKMKREHASLSPNIVRAANELIHTPRMHNAANVHAFFAGDVMPRDTFASTITGVAGGTPSEPLFKELVSTIMPKQLDWSTFWETVHVASMFVQPYSPPPPPRAPHKPTRKTK